MSNIYGNLNYIYNMCDECEKEGFSVSETGATFRNFTQMAVMKYLIFLADYNHSIEKNEVELINEYLGMKLTSEAVQRFVASNVITFDSLLGTSSSILKHFISYDSHTRVKNGSLSLLFISLMEKIGIEFISSDGKCDEKQSKDVAELINRMKMVRDIVIGGRSFIKNAPSMKVPEEYEKEDITKSTECSEETIEIKDNQECETLEELMIQLYELVGLEKVKDDLNTLINLIKVRKLREDRGVAQSAVSLHMIFSGNPGTGKTTVARLISKIYYRLGILSKGHLVEVDRSGLVGGFVGQTAIKTKKVCDSAKGGLLFIDEAYTLTSGNSNDFGTEAVNTILKAMEDNRDDFIVIAAGYPSLMEEFLDVNPGLRSRFNKKIIFEDYTPEELVKIFEVTCSKSGLKASEDARNFTYGFFEKRCGKSIENFANARDVRNYFEKALANQANRISDIKDISDEELFTISLEDVKDISLD